MALQLQEEVLFEGVFDPQGGGQCFIRLARKGQLGELASEATRQSDDSTGVFSQ